VRLAFANLDEISRQADLAEENLRLAQADVVQVRATRAGGSASGLDLQQAETRLATAADGRVAAFYLHSLARLSLAEAIGKVESLEW